MTQAGIGSQGEIQVTGSMTIANPTSETVYFNGCGTTLERQDASSRWESIAGVACLLIAYANPLDGMLPIAAGESRVLPISMRTHQGDYTDDLGGKYRFRVSIVTPLRVSQRVLRRVAQLSMHVISSNEFSLAPD